MSWTDSIPDPPRRPCATPDCPSVSVRAAREPDGLCGACVWQRDQEQRAADAAAHGVVRVA